MLELNRGSLWECVGASLGKGSRHMVLLVEETDEGPMVTTWSEPNRAYSWYGGVTDFLKQFKPTTGTFNFI